MKATYTRTFSVPIMMEQNTSGNSTDKKYVLTIRDMPNEQKPREKLIRDGVALLSMAELLSVILNVGSKKEDVLAMSNRILKEYGEKS
ncbi:MAG TPA: hypothetical protein PK950_02140, partial [Candidatus Paceibacterota bacterium]|nr:hypothetical protein [Candidatus Paceibacterota bacterium]